MNRFASASPLRMLAYGGAITAFVLSLWLLGTAGNLNQPIQPVAAQVAPGYYAALADHHVVIYLNGRPDPVLVTDIDVRTLPDADRVLLEKGLPLAGAEEVNRLLEDYGS